MTTFLEYGQTVLDRRATQGVRGIRSERHRWSVHVSTACFASKPLNEIRAKDIRAWIRDMGAKKAADTRGDRLLTPQSIKRSYALVSSIFTAAVEDEHVESNPCTGVRVPKRVDERETKEKLTYLTVDEQKALASCEAIPYAHRVAIRFAIATGLRQGEQMNLPIADVHLDDPEPYVHVRFGSPNLPPKSGKLRKVPLFGDGLIAAREAVELAKAHPHNPLAIVFPTPTGKRNGIGKPLGRAKVNGKHVCAWKAALRAAGVRDIKWHALRHTTGTNLVTGALGRRWTLEEIQPLMGHSAIQITQIYAKVGDDALKRAARETPANLSDTHSVLAEGPAQVRSYVWRLMKRVQRIVTETLVRTA
jgi:integrase